MADDKKERKPAEQRLSDRVWIGAPANLRWGEEEISGFVEVINLGGIYVATSRVPEVGDYVDLVFSLPGDSARLSRARKRRLPEPGRRALSVPASARASSAPRSACSRRSRG